MAHFDHATRRHQPRRFSILAMLVQMHQLARQRRALAALDPHLRADIGITEKEAETEANRPVWDAPYHWR